MISHFQCSTLNGSFFFSKNHFSILFLVDAFFYIYRILTEHKAIQAWIQLDKENLFGFSLESIIKRMSLVQEMLWKFPLMISFLIKIKTKLSS